MKITFKPLVLSLAALLALFVTINFDYVTALLQSRLQVLPTDETLVSGLPSKDLLIIPSLGIRAPIVYAEGLGEVIFQKALENGVVHHPSTAAIGRTGNSYIFGHSSDYIWSRGNYKSVFATLPQIRGGALIYASDSLGETFTYKVIAKRIVDSDDTSVLDQGDMNQKQLTLQTSYPIGTAFKRFIVVAEGLD